MRRVLEDYYNEICEKFDLSNAVALDLACGAGEMSISLGKRYPGSRFYGIDLRASEYATENVKIIKGDVTCLPYEDNTFDFICSLSSFEHIQDIEKCLSEVRRVLKPRSKFYTVFYAIWSSIYGHHNFNKKCSIRIEPWCQLYLSEEQYIEMMKPHIGQEQAYKQAYEAYRGDYLCRFTRKQYYNFFINSKMFIRELSEIVKFSRLWGEPSLLTEEIKNKIDKELWDDLGVYGFRVLLEKYESL